MAPRGGVAYIDIVPDWRGFTAALRSGMRLASRSLDKFGDQIADEVTRPLDRAGEQAERFGKDAVRAFDKAAGSAEDLGAAADDIDAAFRDAADGLDDIARSDDAIDDVTGMLARAVAEARDARDELERVGKELEDLRRARDVRIDIDVDADQLRRLQVPDIDVGVNVDVGAAKRELGRIPSKIETQVDVDTSGASGKLRGLGKEAEDAGGGIIDGISKWTKSITALAAGLAVAFIAPWVKVLGDAGQWDAAFSSMEAVLGQRGKGVAEAAGKIAAEVYTDAWGSSIGEVSAITARVIRDLPKSAGARNEFGLLELAGFDPEKDAAAIQTATGQIFALAEVLGEDATRVVTAARQLITTGLAKDWSEALDLIGYSARELNDPLNEVLDVFTEYPTQFRKLGLSGKDVIGFLDQLVESGAPSLDKAADALKEFSIRAVDGSKTTADAFRKLGLAPEQIAKDFAAGGPKASAAFIQVVTAIQDAARTSPLAAEQIGVALFGTQWEDLGASILSLDPTKLQVAADGSAQAIADALGSSLTAAWEGLKRTAFTGLATLLADPEKGLVVTAKRTIDTAFSSGQFNFSGSVIDALAEIMRQVQGVWDGSIAPEKAGQIVAALLVGIINAVKSFFGGDASNKAGETASNIGKFFQTVWNDPELRAKLDEFKATLRAWFNTTVLPFLKTAAAEAGKAFAQGLKDYAVSEFSRLFSNPGALFGAAVSGIISWLRDRLTGGANDAVAAARRILLSATLGPVGGLVVSIVTGGKKKMLPAPPPIEPPPVPFLASGGIIDRPTLSVIGEAGPEAVVPLRRLDAYIDTGDGKGGDTWLQVFIGNQEITSLIERTVRRNDLALAGTIGRGRRL